MRPMPAPDLLREWFESRRPTPVTLEETRDPKNDPYVTYQVSYEAVFAPTSLDQARVEVWVTTDGRVAIGFEKASRVAERLNVRAVQDRFAAGHEPHDLSEAGLLSLLTRIADGGLALSPVVIPLVGLYSARAVVRDSALRDLTAAGYGPTKWLRSINDREFSTRRGSLHFGRW